MIEINGVEVDFEHYPDGESRIAAALNLTKGVVVPILGMSAPSPEEVLVRYESDEDLIHLLLVKRLLDSVGRVANLTLAHVPYARMDRAPKGHLFSLKWVADYINWLTFEKVVLRDPHSDVSGAVFDRSEEASCMDALVSRAIGSIRCSQERPRDIYLTFPDAGAQKKYERFLSSGHGRDFFVGLKHRNFDTGKIESVQILPSISTGIWNGAGATALIVDDLCSYGGTFIQTAKELRSDYGFAKVYLVVAHCEKAAWMGEGERALWNHVDAVFTTDSMPERWVGDYPQRRGAPLEFITRYPQKELLTIT